MAGYYDKWYRYNRLDEGVKLAIQEADCPEYMIVIPCMH